MVRKPRGPNDHEKRREPKPAGDQNTLDGVRCPKCGSGEISGTADNCTCDKCGARVRVPYR